MTEQAKCELCGEPMPPGEEMFKFHGYSGNCPKPPLPSAPPCVNEAGASVDEIEKLIRHITGPCNVHGGYPKDCVCSKCCPRNQIETAVRQLAEDGARLEEELRKVRPDEIIADLRSQLDAAREELANTQSEKKSHDILERSVIAGYEEGVRLLKAELAAAREELAKARLKYQTLAHDNNEGIRQYHMLEQSTRKEILAERAKCERLEKLVGRLCRQARSDGANTALVLEAERELQSNPA